MGKIEGPQMPEGTWWPICIDCGEDIGRKTVDWFRRKRIEKGLPDKLPKRCAQCTINAIRKMVRETEDA